MRMLISTLAIAAAFPLASLAADKPGAVNQAPASRTGSSLGLAAPGQIGALTIAPAQVKSAEAATATLAGSGHCKFTVDRGDGGTLSQEADLPASFQLSYIVASYATQMFAVKATGIDGCKGSASAQITVGQPVPYNGGQPVKAPVPKVFPNESVKPPGT